MKPLKSRSSEIKSRRKRDRKQTQRGLTSARTGFQRRNAALVRGRGLSRGGETVSGSESACLQRQNESYEQMHSQNSPGREVT